MARVDPTTDPLILETGEGTDSPEEWKKWIEEGSEETRERELLDQGVDEQFINPPPADEEPQPPAESGGSAFTGAEDDVAFKGERTIKIGNTRTTEGEISGICAIPLGCVMSVKEVQHEHPD